MCKKFNFFQKGFCALFFVVLSLFFSQTLHAYEWVFMVYMAADNNLEQAAIEDFLELSEVGSNDTVAIIVQLDRSSSYYTGYEDWTGGARFIIDQGDTPVLDNADTELGDINMGDAQTLSDFVNWVLTTNSGEYWGASYYALILWNHGDGWRQLEKLRKELRTKGEALSLDEKRNIIGEINELERKLEKQRPWKAVCWDGGGDALTLNELSNALSAMGTDMSLIGFDACLMGMLEVAYQITYNADVMVASEKMEDWYGWPYDTILSDLTDTPLINAEGLGALIVEKYGESSSGQNDTLSAVRLDGPGEMELMMRTRQDVYISGVAGVVSDLAYAVLNEDHNDWDMIFRAQQKAGWYEPYISYRDLKGFADELSETAHNDTIIISALAVSAAVSGCVIKNHSSSNDNANGLSIYFPEWFWGDEYYGGDIDPDYNSDNLLFLQGMQYWDDFLQTYIDAELVPGHSGQKTYSQRVQGGTTQSAYVMVSSPLFPYNPENPEDVSVLDPLTHLQDDLGAYDRDVWRFFRWDPSRIPARYDEYPFSVFDWEELFFRSKYSSKDTVEDLCYFMGGIGGYMVPGNSFWLISKETKNVDITGQLYPTFIPYLIFLYPGWNQIGTPFDFDVDFDTVWVAWIAVSGEEILDADLIFDATSLENTYTSRTLWKYANGSYSATSVMRPGEGYWLKNRTNGYALLVVNPVRTTISEAYRAPLERTLTLYAKASGEEEPPPPPGAIDPESDDGGSGGSGCFIATASFGSPLAGEVGVLRNFRDKYLLTNSPGKLFVSAYYKYSPKIAEFVAKHGFLKTVVRTTLYPVVKSCRFAIEE